MYADDTVIYSDIPKIANPDLYLYQSYLINLEQWCISHKLSMNVSKTQVMILSHKLVY